MIRRHGSGSRSIEKNRGDEMTDRRIRQVTTTRTEPWVERSGAALGPMTAMPDVFVQQDAPQQRIEGFGASFNELGWDALSALADDDRDAVLRELFEPGAGANLSLCRMPVGANDFSRDWYSYDEVPGDLALEHFSIGNDDETLVPFIRAAQAHQPDLRLWASPWSPPSWMKTNGHYAGAMPLPGIQSVENGLRPDQVGVEGTDMMRQDDGHLRAYAGYFGRFVDEYAARGIRIGMVMPQNEFNSPQVFPSCTWTPDGLARFIRVLAEEMRPRGVEIFVGTLERPDDSIVERVLAQVGPLVSGLGAQWAGKGALPFLHHAHPELRVFQTEQECGDGRNDWRYARYSWTLMRRFFEHGAGAYMYWNIALLEGGVSRWGWAQNSLVTVDADAAAYWWNHEYHLLKHVAHFVEVGARVLPTASYTGFEDQLAFVNPDGTTVLVARNDGPDDQRVTYLMDGQVLSAQLPADSFTTLVIDPDRTTGGAR
jgi:glucosylceramidase